MNTTGILPAPAAVLKKQSNPTIPTKSQSRVPLPKLRLIIRRLPPGLTETEFLSALGEEWKVGAGKVDWAAYKEGRISKDPSKPSKPARAYLRVKDQYLLETLSAKIKQTNFQDAKNSTSDPCLLGPPSLEFAPYGKVPGSRVRHDGRQGTIDQDPEFIEFLQKLTEPVTKPIVNEDTDFKPEKVKITPLVQFLKDKKANKIKEAAASKSKGHGKHESKNSKGEKGETKKVSVMKKDSPAADKAKRDKATQDAVKAMNKSVAAVSGKGNTEKLPEQHTAAKDVPQTGHPAKRERERGSAAVAKILQRDLGLAPKNRRTASTNPSSASKSEAPNASPTPQAKANPPEPASRSTASQNTASRPPHQNQPKTPTVPPTAPRNPKSPVTTAQPKPQPTSVQRPPKPPPQPSAGAKSAFLKHANASQGVTEPLLHTAFSVFGELTRCEIDKKKGFGYIDFTDSEGLRKAMRASPIKVGNGEVVVLENRSKVAAKGLNAANPQQSKVQSSPSQSQPTAKPSAEPVKALPSPSTDPRHVSDQVAPHPPTAPKSSTTPVRGGRGGHMGPGRGGFGPRGGRTGMRGRGGFFPNQHRSAGNAGSNQHATAVSPNSTPDPAPPTAGISNGK